MDNPEVLAPQDWERQNKTTKQHMLETTLGTANVNNTTSLLQTTGGRVRRTKHRFFIISKVYTILNSWQSDRERVYLTIKNINQYADDFEFW